MKKIILLSFVSIVLLFSACFREESSQSRNRNSTVVLVTDSTGIDDRSFNASAFDGILRFYGEDLSRQRGFGTQYRVVPCATENDYVKELLEVIDDRPSLIAATGFSFADAIHEVASSYSKQNFLIVDVDWIDVPNVMQAVFAEHEGSYLVGMAAGLTALDEGLTVPTFGFIGGVPSSTITKFEVGYVQGVLSVVPYARFIDFYTNDWESALVAKNKAKEWYDQGVYCIYSAAGGAGLGTVAQAKEHRLAGYNVWAIGTDVDQYEEGLYSSGKSAVLTSMIKNVSAALIMALEAVEEGNFYGKTITMDLASSGVGYSGRNLDYKIIEKLEVARGDIVRGKTKIVSIYEEAKKLVGFPTDLLAVDE